MQWMYELKLVAVDYTGLAKDALHIYVSLVVFVLACWLFRWKAWQWRVLLPVLLVTLANEASDIVFNLRWEKMSYWQGSVHDIINTMILPVLLVMLARWTTLFEPRTKAQLTTEEESSDVSGHEP